MYSKILIKLIDQAIVPAILLLVMRVTSVLVIAKFYGAELTINNAGFIFANPDDYFLVNSYSVLSMLVIISVGILYMLLKAFIFHDSHVSPGLTAKLFSLRLSSFIQTSFDLYSQGIVWLSYLYLLALIAGIMAFFGLLYVWVFAVALVLTVVSTVLFMFDIEHEISFKAVPFTDELSSIDDIEEELVLKFGGNE